MMLLYTLFLTEYSWDCNFTSLTYSTLHDMFVCYHSLTILAHFSLFRMIIHEGNTITEIEEVDVPTSSIMHQIVIGVYLYLYSMHWAFIKNGLFDDQTSTIPITFITIVGMAGRTNNIFYVVCGIIVSYYLIENTRIRTICHNGRRCIDIIQTTMEHTYAITSSDIEKLTKLFLSGYNIWAELMDFPALSIQHGIIDQYAVNLFRRWMRGVTITLLCVTIATDMIKKFVSKHQIPTKATKKLEVGLKGRVINYIILSTILITDAALASDVIVIGIGVIGLIAKNQTMTVKETIAELGPPAMYHSKNTLTENSSTVGIKIISPQAQAATNTMQVKENKMIELYSGNSNAILKQSQTTLQDPYTCRQQIRQRQTVSSVSAPHFPQHCLTTHWNHEIGRNYHKKMTNTRTINTPHIYEMTSKHCGTAVIINNEEFKTPLESRSGTGIDASNLCGLFNYLSFKVQRHDNKTCTEMRQILNDVAAMDHGRYDCLIVAILTHGDYGDVLYGTSGGRITIQEVIETFSGRRCPTLIGKPKIFIIQACRGKRYNQTVELNGADNNDCNMVDSGPAVHPNISDYLVAYSTIPGHVSLRNKNIGSIFIFTLVKIFRRCAADEDLTTMLERVTDEVTKYQPQNRLHDSRQSPEVCSTLRGKVYFNTGKCKCD